MLDLNLVANLYNENNAVGVGVSYRTEKNHYGGQRLSLSPLLRLKLNQFTFGATYNLTMSGIQDYGGNSFMISLGLNLGNFINPDGLR